LTPLLEQIVRDDHALANRQGPTVGFVEPAGRGDVDAGEILANLA
jgi:hypothetical protein